MVIYYLTKQKENILHILQVGSINYKCVVLLKHIFILIYFERIFIMFFSRFDVTI